MVALSIRREARNAASQRAPQLPRFVDHADLRDAAGTTALLDDIETILRGSGDGLSNGQMIALLKGLHLCRMRASDESPASRSGDACNWVGLHQRISDRVARENLGLVYAMRKRFTLTVRDRDHMISEGMNALRQAMVSFNPWKGFRFSTYACNAIRNAFLRVVREESRRREMFSTMGEHAEWPATAKDETDEGTRLFAERLRTVLESNTAKLTETERFVLDRRFPLDKGKAGRTLEKLAALVDMSKESVRKIQIAALGKLRQAMLSDPVLQ